MNRLTCLLICVTSLLLQEVTAQTLLERRVSVAATKRSLKAILKDISEHEYFYFAYNSHILPVDSLVTVSISNAPLLDVLHQLFGSGYVFSVYNNYIIIRTNNRKSLALKGFVLDATTGLPIADATVYSKDQLRSTFTNADGSYSLPLNADRILTDVSAGKVGYLDTTADLRTLSSDTLLFFLSPETVSPDSITVKTSISRSWTWRLLLSSRQRLRSLNLRHFFSGRFLQVSLVPGLSTRGNMSGQVITDLSLNIIGGYTKGTKGVEIGGLFNVNSGSTGYLQMAGAVNATGGSFKGLQITPGHNSVGDTLKGVQLSILLNYARMNCGLQIGLVNASDSAKGISLGLLNFVKNGSRKVALYSSDLVNTVVAYKTGNGHFYNILLAGNNTNGKAIATIGLGLGYEYRLRKWLSLSPEINYQVVKLESWHNRLQQAKLLLNLYPVRGIGVFGGPVLNRYINYDRPESPFKNPLSLEEFIAANEGHGRPVKNWLGWEAGISWETTGRHARSHKRQTAWSAEPFFSIGKQDHSSKWMPAGGLRIQKKLTSDIDMMFSAGYARLGDGAGIPLSAGAKFFAAGPFYLSCGAGFVPGLEKNVASTLTALSAGVELKGGADLSAGYEHFSQLHVEQIFLRFGYHFHLPK